MLVFVPNCAVNFVPDWPACLRPVSFFIVFLFFSFTGALQQGPNEKLRGEWGEDKCTRKNAHFCLPPFADARLGASHRSYENCEARFPFLLLERSSSLGSISRVFHFCIPLSSIAPDRSDLETEQRKEKREWREKRLGRRDMRDVGRFRSANFELPLSLETAETFFSLPLSPPPSILERMHFSLGAESAFSPKVVFATTVLSCGYMQMRRKDRSSRPMHFHSDLSLSILAGGPREQECGEREKTRGNFCFHSCVRPSF